MRKRSNILLHGVVHAVDQGKDAHQQEQPLPERKSDFILHRASYRSRLSAFVQISSLPWELFW